MAVTAVTTYLLVDHGCPLRPCGFRGGAARGVTSKAVNSFGVQAILAGDDYIGLSC